MPPTTQLIDLFQKHAGTSKVLFIEGNYTIPNTPLTIAKIRLEQGRLHLVSPNGDSRCLNDLKGDFLHTVQNGLFQLLYCLKPASI